MHSFKLFILSTAILAFSLQATGIHLVTARADDFDALSKSAYPNESRTASKVERSRGIGTSRAGWVSAQVDLSPSTARSPAYGQSEEKASLSPFRMVSDSSPNVDANSRAQMSGESILDTSPTATAWQGVNNTSPQQVSGFNPLPSTALVAPLNGQFNSSNTNNLGNKDSQAILNSVANPLAGLAGSNSQTFTSGSVGNSLANGTFGRGRMAEWIRSFPLFQLNQSVGTSTDAPRVWQERVQSFFQTPNVTNPPRQSLFSAFLPNQRNEPSTGVMQEQQSSQVPASANGVLPNSTVPNDTDRSTVQGQAVAPAPPATLGSQLNGLRGGAGWFSFRGANRPTYQSYRGITQGSSSMNQGAGPNPVTTQPNVTNDSSVYSANQVPKQGCWDQFWGRWFGTGYRTSSFRVPVTYYRPVITTDPTTGQQVVVQQPCTSYVQQEQRTPIRLFRSARPAQSNQPSMVVPGNACPPAYMAAMPNVIYPGVGYVVAPHPSTGVQQSSYVIAVNGMQPVTVPAGMTVLNGTVLPATATVVNPQAFSTQGFGNPTTSAGVTGQIANQQLNQSGQTNQSASNARPLTGKDLGLQGAVASPPSSSDLTPMQKPRLESYRYTPSDSEVPAGDESTEAAVQESDFGYVTPRSSTFASPSRLGMRGSRMGQMRLPYDSNSDALLEPPSRFGSSRSGLQSAEGSFESDSVNNREPGALRPSLEDLLRSENFVGAEPIAAPQDFRPRYPRRSDSSVRSMSQSAILKTGKGNSTQVVADRDRRRSSEPAELTTISTRLTSGPSSAVDVVNESKWIRQPNTSR